MVTQSIPGLVGLIGLISPRLDWLLIRCLKSSHCEFVSTYLGIPFWNQGADFNSGSSKILTDSCCWYKFDDIEGGGVVAELFVLASPELNPEDPFRLLENKNVKKITWNQLRVNSLDFDCRVVKHNHTMWKITKFCHSVFYVKSKLANVQTCSPQSGIWIKVAINEKSTISVQFNSYFEGLTAYWVC